MTKQEADKLYAKLGRAVARQCCDAYAWGDDVDGDFITTKMIELSLLVEVAYDPAAHGENEDFVIGEEIQIFAKGCEP